MSVYPAGAMSDEDDELRAWPKVVKPPMAALVLSEYAGSPLLPACEVSWESVAANQYLALMERSVVPCALAAVPAKATPQLRRADAQHPAAG